VRQRGPHQLRGQHGRQVARQDRTRIAAAVAAVPARVDAQVGADRTRLSLNPKTKAPGPQVQAPFLSLLKGVIGGRYQRSISISRLRVPTVPRIWGPGTLAIKKALSA